MNNKSKINGHPLTLIAGHPIPKIPSNLEAKKLIPYNLVTCPNNEFLAWSPATYVVSCPIYPTTPPDPYVILNLVPL